MSDRVVITRYDDSVLTFLIKDDRVWDIMGYEPSGNEGFQTGDILKAKVISIQKNINAAFLYLIPGVKAFMDMGNRDDIKPEQEIIVQITKEAFGEKEIVVTPNYSLAGRYMALSFGKKGVGVSRKISGEKREELKELISRKMENIEGLGAVIRTNAENAPAEAIDEEFDSLYERMREIERKAGYSVPYIRIYSAMRPESEYIRDLRESPEKIVTDDPEIYEAIMEDFRTDPGIYEKISLYKDPDFPMTKLYRIEPALDEIRKRTIYLKSSGTLIIDRTEACHVMDVNTGKNTEKLSKDELVLKTNLEAVKEAARQMRIRNLSGMILIDLINMTSFSMRKKVINALKEELKKDRLKADFIDLTGLGIAEVTREKERLPLIEMI